MFLSSACEVDDVFFQRLAFLSNEEFSQFALEEKEPRL